MVNHVQWRAAARKIDYGFSSFRLLYCNESKKRAFVEEVKMLLRLVLYGFLATMLYLLNAYAQ